MKDRNVGEASCYVFPKLKYTSEADFSLTKAERRVALQELRRIGCEALYELVVDREGNIQKIRTIKSLPGSDGDFFTIGFMQRIKERKFKPSRMTALYRTFYFPLDVRMTTEFLGSDGFLD